MKKGPLAVFSDPFRAIGAFLLGVALRLYLAAQARLNGIEQPKHAIRILENLGPRLNVKAASRQNLNTHADAARLGQQVLKFRIIVRRELSHLKFGSRLVRRAKHDFWCSLS